MELLRAIRASRSPRWRALPGAVVFKAASVALCSCSAGSDDALLGAAGGADATGGAGGADAATGGAGGAGTAGAADDAATRSSGGSTGQGGNAGPSGSDSAAPAGPTLGACNVFSPDDPWRVDVSQMASDATWTSALFRNATKKNLHPDFGNAGAEVYGIPINVVPAGQAPVTVSFDYADESDPGPYPFPAPGSVKIEGGTATACDGDCHVLVVEQGACHLYEGWDCHYAGGWHCGSGARFDLGRSSYGQRPPRFTSADAAGLAIAPGLVRYSEVAAGVMNHAIRFTMHCTQDGYVAPASHFAVPTGGAGCPAQASGESAVQYHARLQAAGYPPMGLRIRLKSAFPVAALPPQAKVIAEAMKRYGMILADNGSDYYFQGDVDPGWNDQLDALKAIPGDAFEVLAVGPITH